MCNANPNCKGAPCKSILERKKPVFITGNPVLIAGILFSLQGFPCKTLYFPVWDCSVSYDNYPTLFQLLSATLLVRKNIFKPQNYNHYPIHI